MELHVEYLQRITAADEQRMADKTQDLLENELKLTEEQMFLLRCGHGLSLLQRIDLILLRLMNMGNRPIVDAIRTFFRIKGNYLSYKS